MESICTFLPENILIRKAYETRFLQRAKKKEKSKRRRGQSPLDSKASTPAISIVMATAERR
jgi:hypothetical protein